MLREEEIIKRIAKRKAIDRRVVSLVAHYPFKFVRKVMKDPDDLRPIRLRYFGLFALKPRFKENKYPKKDNKVGNKSDN